MANNSKASVLSFKTSIQFFSIYGCLFNCIYQMDNLSLSVKRTIKFMFNGNSVQTLCYCMQCREVQHSLHCFSDTNGPLE